MSIIGLKAPVISRRGFESTCVARIKIAEGSSASAAGNNVLDPELAGVHSESDSSFDEDQETTEE